MAAPTARTRPCAGGYVAEVVPRLGAVARTEIVKAIGVSRVYARDIARGNKVPHPRHFVALAKLVGVEMRVDRKRNE